MPVVVHGIANACDGIKAVRTRGAKLDQNSVRGIFRIAGRIWNGADSVS
jgi:hypothetical protein